MFSIAALLWAVFFTVLLWAAEKSLVKETVIPIQESSGELTSGEIPIEVDAIGPMHIRGESDIGHLGQVMRVEVWRDKEFQASWTYEIGKLNKQGLKQTGGGFKFNSSEFAGKNLEIKVRPEKQGAPPMKMGATIERIK